MKRSKQLSFIEKLNSDFGGSDLIGKRKSARPISVKKPMHLVLKSTNAKGLNSFVNNQRKIQDLITKASKKAGIKIQKCVINFNHIHLVILLSTRDSYSKFVRILCCEIVKLLKVAKGFFNLRPWTRFVEWGKDLIGAVGYLELNEMELVGLRTYKKRPSKHAKTRTPGRSQK